MGLWYARARTCKLSVKQRENFACTVRLDLIRAGLCRPLRSDVGPAYAAVGVSSSVRQVTWTGQVRTQAICLAFIQITACLPQLLRNHCHSQRWHQLTRRRRTHGPQARPPSNAQTPLTARETLFRSSYRCLLPSRVQPLPPALLLAGQRKAADRCVGPGVPMR